MENVYLLDERATLPPQLDELKLFNNWVMFKLEPKPTKDDPDHLGKIPYTPNGSVRASAKDPRSWSSYTKAAERVENSFTGEGYLYGIGFELGASGYCGIDIDHCIINGRITQEAERIVRVLDSYTEYSISGTGLHIIVKCDPLDRTGYELHTLTFSEDDLYLPIEDLEIYRPRLKEVAKSEIPNEVEGGRFLTISGNVYGYPRPIREATAEVLEIIASYWPKAPELPSTVGSVESTTPMDDDTNRQMILSALDAIDPSRLDFGEWASVVTALKICGFSIGEAEDWSRAGGTNSKHVNGTIAKRWNSFHLRNGDERGAAGIIINRAKASGWKAADAFSDDERREHGRTLHANDNAITEDQDEDDMVADPGEAPSDQEPTDPTATGDGAAEDHPVDPLTAFFEKIQTESYKPYRTGLSFFDNLLGGGILPQSLLILMAAPGTGKTTLCQQIAERIAENGDPVIYFNFEMSREQMLAKAISGRISRHFVGLRERTAKEILQGYKWSDEDREEITTVIENYREKVYPRIRYNPGNVSNNLSEVLATLDWWGTQWLERGYKNGPAVVIDYLHLLTTTDRVDTQEFIKQCVVGLKNYAKKYNTFVIGISATNRESSKSGKINMFSARDSSNIEFTGDYQLALNYYDIETEDASATNEDDMDRLKGEKYRRLKLRLLKGRLEETHRPVNVYFDAAHNSFYDEDDFRPIEDGANPFPDTKAGKTYTRPQKNTTGQNRNRI